MAPLLFPLPRPPMSPLQVVTLLPVGIAVPGTAFAVLAIHVLRRHEYPYYRNLGATATMRTWFVFAISFTIGCAGIALFIRMGQGV